MLEATRRFLVSRKRHYQGAFNGVDGEAVLTDLARFCRADESTFHADARIEGVMQGRREVWLRIQKHMHMTPDELVKYFNRSGD